MLEFLFRRPIAVCVCFLCLSLLGIISYFYLPISLLPNIDSNQITIQVDNTSIETIHLESELINPFRKELMNLKNLENLIIEINSHQILIHLYFKPKTQMDLAFIEVNEKVDMAMNSQTRNTARPLVNQISINDLPLFYLDVFVKEEYQSQFAPSELSLITQNIIKRRLEQLPEISMVDMTGHIKNEIVITPKMERLKQLNLEPSFILEIFKNHEININPIQIQDNFFEYFLKFDRGWIDLEFIKNLEFIIEDKLFNLKDIAEIILQIREEKGVYTNNKNSAISLAIIKKNDSQLNTLNASLEILLKEIAVQFPQIEFKKTQNQTQLLEYALNNLKFDLFLGGMLAISLMGFWMKKLKMALLIALSIPISLLISLLGFYTLNLSLNIVSLGGLILGLSMIIDNSIVVLDSISNLRDSHSPIKSATIGTNEIISPLLTSVLTNCAVFIPLIFLSGFAGNIFYDQALSIILGVSASFLVSIFLLPTLYSLMNFKNSQRKSENIKMYYIYKYILKLSFRNPYTVFVLLIGIIVLSFVVYNRLEKAKLPPFSSTDFELFIDWNEPISLLENQKRMKALSHQFSDKAVEWLSWTGIQQYHLSHINIRNTHESIVYGNFSNSLKLNKYKTEIKEYIEKYYPQTLIQFNFAKNPLNQVLDKRNNNLELQILNRLSDGPPDMEELQFFISQVQTAIPEIKIDPLSKKSFFNIKIDFEKVIRNRISPLEIVKKLKEIFLDLPVGNLFSDNLSSSIILKSNALEFLDKLQDTFVKNQSGQEFILKQFLQIDLTEDFKTNYVGLNGNYYPLNVHTQNPNISMPAILKILQENQNLKGEFYGNHFENKALIKEMLFVLIISIFLLYFLLAAQFESLIQPLFILIELPFALTGSLIFLSAGKNDLNVMAMIGIIVMTGLIINDSILKIDAINRLRNSGVPLLKAILLGSQKRLNSILLITITSLGALLPTLFMNDLGSEMQKPLVLALLGGLIFGLLFSLFIVPLIYWKFYKHQTK